MPDGVCRILLKGSQKRPEDRYGSAGDLLRELEAVLGTPDQSHTFAGPWGGWKRGPARSSQKVNVEALRQRLALAQQSHDTGAELETWRGLYERYSEAGQRDAAADAYRRAVALYVQVHAPGAGDSRG